MAEDGAQGLKKKERKKTNNGCDYDGAFLVMMVAGNSGYSVSGCTHSSGAANSGYMGERQ